MTRQARLSLASAWVSAPPLAPVSASAWVLALVSTLVSATVLASVSASALVLALALTLVWVSVSASALALALGPSEQASGQVPVTTLSLSPRGLRQNRVPGSARETPQSN